MNCLDTKQQQNVNNPRFITMHHLNSCLNSNPLFKFLNDVHQTHLYFKIETWFDGIPKELYPKVWSKAIKDCSKSSSKPYFLLCLKKRCHEYQLALKTVASSNKNISHGRSFSANHVVTMRKNISSFHVEFDKLKGLIDPNIDFDQVILNGPLDANGNLLGRTVKIHCTPNVCI